MFKKQRNMWKTGISWPFSNFPSVHINVVSCLRPQTLEASAASQCGWMPFVGDEGCAQNEKISGAKFLSALIEPLFLGGYIKGEVVD